MRIGILGASRIADEAIIAPARHITIVELVAIAARNLEKAQAFASVHGIARAFGRYDALFADPDIDLVLPGGTSCQQRSGFQ
jgi:predicted dehydrogenase